jgi:hypothetical protein
VGNKYERKKLNFSHFIMMLGGMLFFANIFSVNPIDNKIGVSFFSVIGFSPVLWQTDYKKHQKISRDKKLFLEIFVYN